MAKEYKAVRLEQALQVWETMCFIPAMILRYGSNQAKALYKFDISGAVANYHKLKNALLKTSESFNPKDYLGNEAFSDYSSEMYWFPLNLFIWTRLSRRVFNFSQDLQTLLSAISLERVTWSMLNPPLGSFVINLFEPLNDGLGWEFDCILFSDVTYFFANDEEEKAGKVVFHLMLFSTNLDEMRPITSEIRRKMWKAISRRHYSLFAKSVEKYYPGVENHLDVPKVQNARSFFVEVFPDKNESVLQSLDRQIKERVDAEDKYQLYSVIGKALHQVVAFCLYLDSLKSSQKSEAIEQIKSNGSIKDRNIKSISDVSEVFLVKCEHYLSDEEKNAISKIRQIRKSDVKCVHWRRGYCRRMPGSGNNPNAPKVVIVRPALVNSQYLKPDMLPSGSKSILV